MNQDAVNLLETTMISPVLFKLNEAYAVLNDLLFSGKLSRCLLTTNRRYGSYGYFTRHPCDPSLQPRYEISLNSAYATARTTRSTLATMACLMCDQRAVQDNIASRRSYKTKQRVRALAEIGLVASRDGTPTGVRNRDTRRFFIVSGGPVDLVCQQLVKQGLTIPWADYEPLRWPDGIDGFNVRTFDLRTFRECHAGAGGSAASNDMPGVATDQEAHHEAFSVVVRPRPEKHLNSKTTYQCPCCRAKVWGRRRLAISCGTCRVPYQSE